MHAQRERTPWRTYARLYGMRTFIRDPLAEILELLDRVLIRGEGWGPGDPLRGERRFLELFPGLLAKRARKRGGSRHESTYRRALARGERLGLLLVERRSGLPPLVSPSWWTHPADGSADGLPERIWSAAAARILPAFCAPLARPLRGYPVPVETGASVSLPNGIQGDIPAQTGGTLLRCNTPTLVGDIVRDTVCASAQSGLSEGEQRGPRPRRRTRAPLPIQTPELRETAEQTIRETAEHPSWSGIEALVRKALETNSPESVVSILRETFNLWQTGNVEYPKAFIRRRLNLPVSFGETPMRNRSKKVRETRPALTERERWNLQTREDLDSARIWIDGREDRRAELEGILERMDTQALEALADRWAREDSGVRMRAKAEAEAQESAARRFHQESREYQAQAVQLAEGNPARWSALLAARERRDSEALRELVSRWSLEDRERPPARAQRLHRATEDAPEALCAAI